MGWTSEKSGIRSLETAGFSVPKWQLIKPGEELNPADYGQYVVTKPDRGARGALVKIKKTARVRYKSSERVPL